MKMVSVAPSGTLLPLYKHPPLSMFFVELMPAPNNKDIECIQQCKIKFEPSKRKMDIVQCANCKDMGTPKVIAISNRDASKAQMTA
jgi:hypothetical protein